MYTHGCDGQIGIKLKNKFNDFIVGILALYLSPDNYKYGRDAEEFFNNATVIWQDLSDSDLLIGAGDVNSRTKMLLDYVPDVDGSLIPPRSNPDNVKNAHAESFLSFLKDNNSIILNGRVTPQFNNFTFVKPTGCSVPDYIFCPIEHLQFCTEMRTHLIREIVNISGLEPPVVLPDHSVLVGTFITSNCNQAKNSIPVQIIYNEQHYQQVNANIPKRQPKKNLKCMNKDFFMSDDVKLQLQNTISRLENIVNNQSELDTLWADVKNIFIDELSSLPDVPFSSNKKQQRKF